ncbi:MAG: Bug family tripartite tricarboxylate transporter substrate binding protein, partial [Candidatus Binatia bacterium]
KAKRGHHETSPSSIFAFGSGRCLAPGRAAHCDGAGLADARSATFGWVSAWGWDGFSRPHRRQPPFGSLGPTGRGGTIALDAAAHAAADGYTLLITAGGPATYGFLFSLGFDPVADLAPLSVVGRFPNMMVVPNSSPWKSLNEFIAYAKSNPGKINWASPGVGTSPHLAGELFKRMAGIEMTHVPYRGVAAGAMSDLLAGRLDAMFNTTGSLLQAVRASQVRGLGVTSGERFATAPEIPTIAESGVPGYDVESFYGLWAPARTPREIVERMNADIVKGTSKNSPYSPHTTNCLRMIPLRSRSDSFTFTAVLSAIASDGNFSTSP